ncbi:pectinesterase family protein [Niallia sp. JL1B1071]|uniref:pectinesterase family protein n=1 Tax=Niallia tiangongensis TaxID=3237105 RepID=UPI0037DD264C
MGKLPAEAFVKNPLQFVIGKSESSDFTSIQEALHYCSGMEEAVTFLLLSGDYEGNILLYQSNRKFIGIGTVRIIGNKHARQVDVEGKEIGTFQTATLFINAENIWIENVEIINNAGPGETVGQAVALYNEGNKIVFKSSSFKGFQDTICLGPLPSAQKDGSPFSTPEMKHEYPNKRISFIHCYIEGTVDFIFGGGEGLFENCELKSLKRPADQPGYITAASTPKGKIGFSFSHCYVTAESNVENVYLGRPWRPYAKVTFSQCRMGAHIHPDRWDDWGRKENRETVTYKEKDNVYEQMDLIKKLDWIQIEPK